MKKYWYFASDFHLGIGSDDTAAFIESQVSEWMLSIAESANGIYLVGDIFDFWFEYKHAVPKGFSQFLATVKTLRLKGVPISFFTGNHDMWMFDYFEKEYGIPVYRKPITETIAGHSFYIGHGDGLGPGDYKYKMLKKVFANRLCQWAFSWLHPNIGMAVAQYWSRQSRLANSDAEHFLGPDKEWLVQYSEKYIQHHPPPDFFVFGHRHLPIDYTLSNQHSRYINLGEWMHSRSYGVFDGQEFQLRFFDNPGGKVFP